MRRPSLRAGDPAPDFTLATPWGEEVSLLEAVRRAAVVLEFLRGTWDPSSRRRLEELDTERVRLLACRARILAVSCESAAAVRARLRVPPHSLALLADETGTAARAYGVFRRFSFGAFRVARPATFVIDRCGFLRYTFVGRLPIRAAPLEEIARVLAQLDVESRRGREGS